jgi:hypothetical protein
MLDRLEVFDHFFAFFELDEGLLPVLGLSRAPPDAADLARLVLGPDGLDLDLEQLFDGLLDLDLVAAGDLSRPGSLLELVLFSVTSR